MPASQVIEIFFVFFVLPLAKQGKNRYSIIVARDFPLAGNKEKNKWQRKK